MDFSLQGNLKPICPDHMVMWIGSAILHLFMYFITSTYGYYIKSETPWNCKWYETDFKIHYSGPFHKVSSCCCNARRHLKDNTYVVLYKSNKVTLQKGHIYKITSQASKSISFSWNAVFAIYSFMWWCMFLINKQVVFITWVKTKTK